MPFSFGLFPYFLGFYRNLCNYFRIHSDSLESHWFYWILPNSFGFSRIPLNFWFYWFYRILSNSSDSQEFSGIPLNFLRSFSDYLEVFNFFRILPNFRKFPCVRIFSDSINFSRRHADSLKLSWILLNSLRFYRILSNPLKTFRLFSCSVVFFHILWESLWFYRILSEYYWFYRIFPNSVGLSWIKFELSRILWYTLRFSRFFSDSSGFQGVTRILSNSFGFFLVFFQILLLCSWILPDSLKFSWILLNSPESCRIMFVFFRILSEYIWFFQILLDSHRFPGILSGSFLGSLECSWILSNVFVFSRTFSYYFEFFLCFFFI